MKPGSFVLVPPVDSIDFWRLDYDKLQSEMIYGQPPAFSELLKKLERIQHSVNADNI